MQGSYSSVGDSPTATNAAARCPHGTRGRVCPLVPAMAHSIGKPASPRPHPLCPSPAAFLPVITALVSVFVGLIRLFVSFLNFICFVLTYHYVSLTDRSQSAQRPRAPSRPSQEAGLHPFRRPRGTRECSPHLRTCSCTGAHEGHTEGAPRPGCREQRCPSQGRKHLSEEAVLLC